jgi:hypothetical protein
MTVEVIRSFDGHEPGEIVDASGWLWTEHLIAQRYVRPIYAPPADKPSGKPRRTEA